MSQILAGKVAIVTGGASGIGLATVEEFVSHGAQVVIADISDAQGEAAAKRLGSAVRFVYTDVSDEAHVARVVEAAVENFGKLDVMFNNAAVTGDPASFFDVQPEAFEHIMKYDVLSVVLGHKHAGRQFRKQGTGGSIISTASIAAFQGAWGAPLYSVAKTAIPGIMRAAAPDFAIHGIRTNVIAPGIVSTPIIPASFGIPPEEGDAFMEFLDARLRLVLPLGRLGRGQDIAGAAVYLASDLAQWVTGSVIVVDGGVTAISGSPAFRIAADAGEEWATGCR